MIQSLHNYEYPGTVKERYLQTHWKLKCENINDMGVLGFSASRGWIQGVQGEGKMQCHHQVPEGYARAKSKF